MMRSLAETKARWEETLRHSSSIAELRRAVKLNGPESLCLSGCRSLCWKAFLMFQDAPVAGDNWSHTLLEARNSYGALREQHLRYIKHPELLAELSFDPLADDPDSPWDAVRKDELIRAEILQDVQRLPDEPLLYHEEHIQTMILDILFLWCKLNPDVGGYRQGMHELLAPIVYVVAQDAIEREAATQAAVDPAMVEMLDSLFVEHDAYALFSHIMGRAKPFYEVGGTTAGSAVPQEQSAIVEKSKYIHEVALMKIDQELANHLKDIEVLPQIFLIRWVRLLFGREFPFEQLLVLWDTIFAVDPKLELVDLICVAMMLRQRWNLLEADYAVALQLLLKYPSPEPPHGPHTFVDDAIYLRGHPTAAGGAKLIKKYTGKTPTPAASSSSARSSRAPSPAFQGFGSLRPRTLGAKSPLSASARALLQQPGGVEALLQGAAKGVIERGEKLGINQAMRDAMGEIRRNVQGFQEGARKDDRPDSSIAALRLMEQRNRQLATMLDETIDSLKLLAASKLEGEDKDKQLEMVEIAAAKIQFVKVHLEDSSLAVPLPPEQHQDLPVPAMAALSISPSFHKDLNMSPTVALDTTPVVVTSAVEEARSTLSSSPASDRAVAPPPTEQDSKPGSEPVVGEDADKMDTDDIPAHSPATSLNKGTGSGSITPLPAIIEASPDPGSAATFQSQPTPPVPVPSPDAVTGPTKEQKAERPRGPIPTRSTLAQSSFAWMLEPDTTMSSISSRSLPSSPPSGSNAAHKKRGQGPHNKHSVNSSRERNAFLFGEVISDGDVDGEKKLSADEIFGLQPISRKDTSKSSSSNRGGGSSLF
ncbi:TBC1 domain family member 5 [Diplogelasinospora grovesii]|uniref:TBC1 domain family member 5 n=1 Tax=Diplogelasinospora grovesii TaxID=303347 RepID=A0AAN6NJ64_9PEZI|nr:TBC1 domain family member 5 [Diplogelasinospora grovesii]